MLAVVGFLVILSVACLAGEQYENNVVSLRVLSLPSTVFGSVTED